MSQPGNGQHGDSTVAAVLRLTDLAARIERVGADATRRIEELAADCAVALEQVTGLRGELGTLGGRADQIEHRLAEVGTLLRHMSGQITELATAPQEPGQGQDDPGYEVNPVPPWWKPSGSACEDARARLRDWVNEIYRPVFGYLGDLLAPCWQQHPLCLAYLDVLHEAWCLLHIPDRDAKTVFAQLDWLTRSLLQAADVMANETRTCRDQGSHREPSQAAARPGLPPAASR